MEVPVNLFIHGNRFSGVAEMCCQERSQSKFHDVRMREWVVDVKHTAGRSVARVLGIRETFTGCWWSAPSSALASSSAGSPRRISCKIDGNGVLQVQHASFHNDDKDILSGNFQNAATGVVCVLTQGQPMARPTTTTSVRQAFAHVYIIDLAGELTSSVDAALLSAYQQASSDARVVILNFSHLAYKNSSGIKLLVKLLTRGNAAGQRLFAVGLNAEYRDIFQVTQLDQGITVYASEADALQAAHDLLDTPGAPISAPSPNVAPAQSTVTKRPTDSWATPVERLNIAEIPAGALNLNVQGRPLFGPLQGFGQLWLKTYRIGLRNSTPTAQEVIATWKQNVAELKPPQKHFYPSSIGIKPNELVLIDAQTPGGPISTGVMVLYAGAESFTLMTPAGHPLAGWVTFSSYIEDGCTFAQVQVLGRASDPLYELVFRFAGSKLQDQIWTHVLTALATRLGASGEVQMHKTLLDPKIQWGRAGNIWYNAQLRTLLYSPITLLRWISAWFRPGSRGKSKREDC
jgi:anti-anti-sigma factor